MSKKVLAINPGSTSTKVAVFEDEKVLFTENVTHTDAELGQFEKVADEFDMRKDKILSILEEHNFDVKELDGVVGRGGLLSNVKAGGYLVNENLKVKLSSPETPEHASNLGGLISEAIASTLGIPAYIYDAVGADELEPIAKITGFKEFTRHSLCHVLNTKAMVRKYAESIGKKNTEINALVAHLGGGISISCHKKGRIVDVITADGGPFSPERSGSVPLNYIVNMCFSGEYTKAEIKKKIAGNGGMKAYLGTSDCREVEKMIADGNEEAKRIYEAQAYQIAKGIGELAPVLKGDIDVIIITGGIAYSKMLTEMVIEYVKFLGKVEVLPGENELESLAAGAIRILNGEEVAFEV